jgi:hypothetical protein
MDDAGVKTIFEKETYKMVRRGNGVAEGSYKKEELLVMGVIVPLFLVLELKKKELL